MVFNEIESRAIELLCRQGKIDCVACKKSVADKINAALEPIREKRAFYEARPSIVSQALQEGIMKTLKESQETIGLVREALHFDYRDLLQNPRMPDKLD